MLARFSHGSGRRELAWLVVVTVAWLASSCRRSRPQLSRGDAAVVMVAAPMPAPPGVKVVLRESDAPSGEGPMVITLAAGRPMAMEGALDATGKGDEEDLYLIELVSPSASHEGTTDGGAPVPTHQLAVEITPSSELGTRLAVRDGNAPEPQGRVLATSRGGPARRHALPNVAAIVGGRYLLSVRRGDVTKAASATGQPLAYMLVLRAAPLGAADEREPNDTSATASVTGPAHSEPQAAGYLGGPGDKDVFQVPMGQTAENTRFLVEVALPPEGAATVTVSDATGRKVAQTRGRKGERAVVRNLTPAALKATGQPGAAHFLVEVATEGAGEPFRRYVLGVRSDVADPAVADPAAAAPAAPAPAPATP